MFDAVEFNEALDRCEKFVLRLVEEYSLDQDSAEHDIFYGHPEFSLSGAFYELKDSGRTLSSETFEEAMGYMEVLRGKFEAAEYREAFSGIVAG